MFTKENSMILGIDLGTTNSVVAVASEEQGRINTPVIKTKRVVSMGARGNPRIEKKELLPSYVGYDAGEMDVFVGDYAKVLCQTRPYAVAKSIKSQMGESHVSIPGWSDTCPDQTPEAVASRILAQIKHEVGELYDGIPVDETVITVPASFNPAQREATMRAAELAGFKVRGQDGNYRQELLLSEPEAVVYDVMNQVENGTILLPVDFTEPKLVMVFDIGGGTLDITIHIINRDAENPKILDIKPIATNRYCTIAGDSFDLQLANAMMEQYQKDYHKDSTVARELERDREKLMPAMLQYAEELKVDISEYVQTQRSCKKEISKEKSMGWGGEMPNGYSCESDITIAEVENILKPLLGQQYIYEDYKRVNQITDNGTILTPVLDVLQKASKKLHTDDLVIDAVILNGGMSCFYLIVDRLTEFFGFRPIQVSDPDKSVAQGAAVYHYYLRTCRGQMSNKKSVFDIDKDNQQGQEKIQFVSDNCQMTKGIRTKGNVLNESLYVGTKNGSVVELAQSGQDLPCTGEVSGFELPAGQTRLQIPIKQKEGNTYQKIACGSISVPEATHNSRMVTVSYQISEKGMLFLETWSQGKCLGMMNLVLGREESKYGKKGKNLVAPAGAKLHPANELSSLKKLVDQLKKQQRNKEAQRKTLGKIATIKKSIQNCGNPEEFSKGLLELFQDNSAYMVWNVMPVARQLCGYWTQQERAILVSHCRQNLQIELSGYGAQNIGINAVQETIRTLGECGTQLDCACLDRLKGKRTYRTALLSVYAKQGMEHQWIYECFKRDWQRGFNMVDTTRAVGISVYQMAEGQEIRLDLNKVAHEVMDVAEDGRISREELVAAIMTLGLLCQKSIDKVEERTRQEALTVLDQLNYDYDDSIIQYVQKAVSAAKGLMGVRQMEIEDERYLLDFIQK